jgi:isopentenyl-diphosphate Delta-isomerase
MIFQKRPQRHPLEDGEFKPKDHNCQRVKCRVTGEFDMQLTQEPFHLELPSVANLRPRIDNSSDHVIVVDANDTAIGTAPKLEAHRTGLRHRAISIIIGDRHRRILLHRRAAGKYHSGGLWTNTSCSHPRPGEHASEAAVRRLVEEMGISCPLAFMFSMNYRAEVSNGLIEDEIVHVFGGRFDGAPIPDPIEVSDWCWKPFGEVEQDVDARPDSYTIWFRKIRNEFWSDIVVSLYGRGPGVEPKPSTA